jgi:putative spermidine/putrescine transport system ATP-binding protein
VSDFTFLGNNVHVVTKTSKGDELAVRLPFGHEAISSLSQGDAVWLRFDAASAHVFS